MAYKKILLKMDTASNDAISLVPRGSRIVEIVLFSMPAGVSFKLAIGDNELFTIDKPFTSQPQGDDMQNNGLSWANPVARPGVVLEMLVAFGESTVRAGVAP